MRKLNYKVVNDKIIVKHDKTNEVLFILELQNGQSPLDTIEEHMKKKDMYVPMYELVNH